MKFSFLWIVVLVAAVSLVPVQRRDNYQIKLPQSPSGGVKIDFDIINLHFSFNLGLNFDRRSIDAELENRGYFYRTKIQVGSDNQEIEVNIDTGSSDLWVMASNVTCVTSGNQSPDFCKTQGIYDPSNSTTSQDLNSTFQIVYVDQSGSKGEFFKDDVTLSSAHVKSAQFGVAYLSTLDIGLLGIGLRENESKEPHYPNFPEVLVQQGIILKNYYSLFLNGPLSSTGSLIFGGIDDTKYTGDLTYVDIVSPREFRVNLGEIVLEDNTHVNASFTSLLDSGTTLTILPQNVADAIAKKLNGLYDENSKKYTFDCNVPSGSMNYKFDNGAVINVPYSSLLWYKSGTTCFMGIARNSDPLYAILGDNFLRSAYVVYDLDDRKIGLAQAKW